MVACAAAPSVASDVKDTSWPRGAIDRFILAALEAKGLKPSPEADRRTLIRRLYFDLIGLPPTPEEVEAFVADSDPQAYEKLVDRLLASPHYGERWARHWLDVVHYGETHGYDKDKPRPNAWPYRDYVIRAFNDDKPYARFVQEQIAGDVLFPGTADGIEALGFIAAGPWDFIGHAELRETKIDGKIARHLDRDDMVANTIDTFLSLTVHCAQCHDHKFDPDLAGGLLPPAGRLRRARSRRQAVLRRPGNRATTRRARRDSVADAQLQSADEHAEQQVTQHWPKSLRSWKSFRRRGWCTPALSIAARAASLAQAPAAAAARDSRACARRRDAARQVVAPGAIGRYPRLSRRASICQPTMPKATAGGARPLAHRREQPAHLAVDRQPRLAVPLRPRHRRYAQRFRPDGGAADAPRAARLAGGGVPRRRTVAQAAAPADRHQRHLPADIDIDRAAELRNRSTRGNASYSGA